MTGFVTAFFKFERLLRLNPNERLLLTANTTYNVDQLAERLQMSRRTVYRYIDTFREAGFVIKKVGEHIRLDKESPHFRDISQLVHFTEEEAVILKSAIENIDDDNLLKQNLKRKLYSVYDNNTLADTVVRGKNAPNIRRLIEAIDGIGRPYCTATSRRTAAKSATAGWSLSPLRPITCRCGATISKATRTSSSKPRASGQPSFPQTPGNTGRSTAKGSSTPSACTAEHATGCGWNWGRWPTTCSARSIRWPNATSGRWAGKMAARHRSGGCRGGGLRHSYQRGDFVRGCGSSVVETRHSDNPLPFQVPACASTAPSRSSTNRWKSS